MCFEVLLSLKYYLYLEGVYYIVSSYYGIKEVIIGLEGYLS
jgi:hypothetical protein